MKGERNIYESLYLLVHCKSTSLCYDIHVKFSFRKDCKGMHLMHLSNGRYRIYEVYTIHYSHKVYSIKAE